MITAYRFSEETESVIKNEIEEYDGGEIFFGCSIDEEGIIFQAQPICYGNEEMVLAPYEIAEKFSAVLHNHPSGITQPSAADMQYASVLKNQGIGFFITNNTVSRLTTVIPPIVLQRSRKITEDELEEFFCNNGKIAKMRDGYEVRENQLKMSKTIAQAFNDNELALIEASTGIGKSLAYLIPAFLYADKNNARVVVSTNTITLQSQLINKDIPFVKKLLDSPSSACLVKGRRHYFCKMKAYHLDNELEFSEETQALNEILEWGNTTATGAVDELNFVPEAAVWEKVASDADFCLSNQCIFFRDCFLQKARRAASEANILIVNHHVLFADLQLRYESGSFNENILLPPYQKIIFDEAHNIEKAASSYFTHSFSKSGFYKFLSLYRGKRGKSFLKSFVKKMYASSSKVLYAAGEYVEREVCGNLEQLYAIAGDELEKCGSYIRDIVNREYQGGRLSINYRVLPQEWDSEDFREKMILPLRTIIESMDTLLESMKQVNTFLDSLSDKEKMQYEMDFRTIQGFTSKLDCYMKELSILLSADERSVNWIEIFGEEEAPFFNIVSSPLYINHFLHDALHSVFETVIFTSATLTVNKKFDFFMNMTGLNLVGEEKKLIVKSFESPFHYDDVVLFAVPVDIPEPNHPDYNSILNRFIYESVKTTKGSAFVLFTSYQQLTKSYDEVNPLLRQAGYRSFRQGDKPKDILLSDFILEKDSSLFGTDSFWEGVDAPGDTLRYVMLTKLPFRMPTEPLEQARVEDMERRGINSFVNYTVPTAVIKFRQGFGRLIRTNSDYGIVALLDSRVISKSYGKTFFASLPRCKFVSGTTSDIMKAMEAHINIMENKQNQNK